MNSETNQPISNPAPADKSPRGAAVPIWIIVAMFLLCYWGALYFDEHGGWFDAKVYSPYTSLADVKNFQPVSGGANPIELGLAVYNKPTCVACHQASGQGTPGQFPPLSGSEWVNEPQPGRVIRIVLRGLQGPITVKGQSYNNVMVPWGGVLSDDEIAAVLTYVRENKEWGNNAPAVTPAQVKAVRGKIQNHPGAFTPDELKGISPAE